MDCGLFQGLKELRERNWQPLPIRADSVSAVVLTHAHLDHCGFLPRLVNQGFRGRIFCTPATAELARIVLADAAHLQEEDAERANRKGYTKHSPALPLFTTADAESRDDAAAAGRLRPADAGRARHHRRCSSTRAIFWGPAYARVHVESAARPSSLAATWVATRDPCCPIPRPLTRPTSCSSSPPTAIGFTKPDDDGARLAEIITETVERGGKVIIPAFALGRVEELLYWINRLEEEHRIPVVPVYVDSPMAAIGAAGVPRSRRRARSRDLARRPATAGARRRTGNSVLFCTQKLKVVSTIPESRAVQESRTPSIVISASGMATGGRVLHHLAHALPRCAQHGAVCRISGRRHSRPAC